MSESTSHINIEHSSPKSFGVIFSIVFLIIALYPLITSNDIRFWSLFVSAIFMVLACFAPQAFVIPNKIWIKLGDFLGSIIAPLVLLLIFFSTVFPTGLVMRLIGKDLLRLKLNKNARTYWIKRKDPMGSMKRQF